jgi:hypothetical protein
MYPSAFRATAGKAASIRRDQSDGRLGKSAVDHAVTSHDPTDVVSTLGVVIGVHAGASLGPKLPRRYEATAGTPVVRGLVRESPCSARGRR